MNLAVPGFGDVLGSGSGGVDLRDAPAESDPIRRLARMLNVRLIIEPGASREADRQVDGLAGGLRGLGARVEVANIDEAGGSALRGRRRGSPLQLATAPLTHLYGLGAVRKFGTALRLPRNALFTASGFSGAGLTHRAAMAAAASSAAITIVEGVEAQRYLSRRTRHSVITALTPPALCTEPHRQGVRPAPSEQGSGASNPPFRIGWIGSVAPGSGVEEFLDLAQHAGRDGSSVEFVVIGTAQHGAATWFAAQRARVSRLPMRWVTGQTSAARIDELDRLDAVYLPDAGDLDDAESAGIAVLARGVPLVGNTPPDISAGAAPALLPAATPAEAWLALRTMQQARRDELAAAGLQHASTVLYRTFAQRHLALYHALAVA